MSSNASENSAPALSAVEVPNSDEERMRREGRSGMTTGTESSWNQVMEKIPQGMDGQDSPSDLACTDCAEAERSEPRRSERKP